jgi:hypothetical protein
MTPIPDQKLRNFYKLKEQDNPQRDLFFANELFGDALDPRLRTEGN